MPPYTLRQGHQRVQHVVQLIGVPHIRPSLIPDLGNRTGIELSHFFQHRLGQHAPHLDGASPTLLQGSVIQVGVRIGINHHEPVLHGHDQHRPNHGGPQVATAPK